MHLIESHGCNYLSLIIKRVPIIWAGSAVCCASNVSRYHANFIVPAEHSWITSPDPKEWCSHPVRPHRNTQIAYFVLLSLWYEYHIQPVWTPYDSFSTFCHISYIISLSSVLSFATALSIINNPDLYHDYICGPEQNAHFALISYIYI